MLSCAFGRIKFKNAVEQWGRERLQPVGMVCSWGTSRKMLGKERSGSFEKERCLLKILSARHLKSFTLGENGELTYGSQFNFITVPSRGRWKNKMWRQMDKIYNEISGRRWLKSWETYLTCYTEIPEQPWVGYSPSLCLIFLCTLNEYTLSNATVNFIIRWF